MTKTVLSAAMLGLSPAYRPAVPAALPAALPMSAPVQALSPSFAFPSLSRAENGWPRLEGQPLESPAPDRSALKELVARAEIVHNAAEKRFEATVDGHKAELQYRYLRDGSILAIHTGVPAPIERLGMASRLTEALIQHAREKGIKVNPVCKFVSAYMLKHPEHHDVVHPQARSRVGLPPAGA